MAFLKYAKASVVTPFVTRQQWTNVRVAGESAKVDLPSNLVERAASLFDQPFDPKKYLLTHATIVASVDVYAPPGVKVGKVQEEGFKVNRKYSDYRVKGDCQKYINNNRDCWSRAVLAKSYKTFVGSHNFVEHVQIEDLSKGRIIDAVARDIGESVYVDILIATDRKHKDLVEAIQSGKMGTLSMGCTVDGTICTKCGHWASDETEMCPHVKYEKGNTFYDKEGRKHIVAELCGHEDLDPTGGVKFIEASWVATPAFTGAVLRNVLEPTVEITRKARKVLSSPPNEWDENARKKAAFSTDQKSILDQAASRRRARLASVFAQDDVMSDPSESGGEGEEAKKEPANPLKDLEEQLTQTLFDKVKKRVEESIKDDQPTGPADASISTNESLSRLANRTPGMVRVYEQSLRKLAKTASTDIELVDRIADYNQGIGLKVPVSVYRASLKVGAMGNYGSSQEFLSSCRKALGRSPTKVEAGVLIRLGKLLSQVG